MEEIEPTNVEDNGLNYNVIPFDQFIQIDVPADGNCF